MKFILGGGLVALLTRDILGSEWHFIPYAKSRLYSFNPPLCDNYVIKDDTIDEYMDQFALIPYYTKNSFSLGGQLTQNTHLALGLWLHKVYGSMVPPQAESYWRSHMEYFSYGDCLEIYRRLYDKYVSQIIADQEKYGKTATKIVDHLIITNTGTFQYDNIISTIPIHVLAPTMGLNLDFPSNSMWCYHIKTKWDMEGAAHILVADEHLEFYKVTQVNKTDFIFYSTKEIKFPGRYFMNVLGKDFELIGEIELTNGIPCGPVPDIESIASAGVELMGSRAIHDDCIDIGSAIKRLVKKANA